MNVKRKSANMDLSGLFAAAAAAFKLPTVVVSGATAVLIIFVAFGFQFKTPAAAMQEYQATHTAEHVRVDSAFADISRGMDGLQENTGLVEALVRGECIREPVENLQRQGLINKCRELGIER